MNHLIELALKFWIIEKIIGLVFLALAIIFAIVVFIREARK